MSPRRTPFAVAALAVGAVSLSLLWPGLASVAAASPHGPSATVTAQRTVAQKAPVAACTPSQISSSVELYTLGKSPSAPAGAVLFHNTSRTACSLRGVPTVGVLDASGQRIAVYQRSSTPRRPVAAVLQPSSSGKAAGSSLTWSSWSCPEGSFSLTIRFPGWSTSVAAAWGVVAGYSGSPCAVTGATLYVSAVATITH
jgi:Protein of unknown function (DUF4232)